MRERVAEGMFCFSMRIMSSFRNVSMYKGVKAGAM